MSAPQPAAGSPRKVLLDCDPGIDDALAIAFACGHPGLDLCGVTTVAGNIGLAQATANALSVLEFVGRPDVPLAEGSAAPLLRAHVDARDVHGDSGLGQARLPPAQARPVDADATDLIIDTIGASPGEITLVATGPLTNIALAVRRQPGLVRQVADFVIMGGSATRGNTTPAAEFNIATDPEAAAIVFAAGWQVTMVGLDATLQARADDAVKERLAGLGRLGSDLLLPALGGYTGADDTTPEFIPAVLARGMGTGRPCTTCAHWRWSPSPACSAAWPARVEVETAGRWTAGMTVTKFGAPAGERNALVATSIEVPGFWEAVIAAWARVPPAQPAG